MLVSGALSLTPSAADGDGDRGIRAGGKTGVNSNVIDYITISSIGNASGNHFSSWASENMSC